MTYVPFNRSRPGAGAKALAVAAIPLGLLAIAVGITMLGLSIYALVAAKWPLLGAGFPGGWALAYCGGGALSWAMRTLSMDD